MSRFRTWRPVLVTRVKVQRNPDIVGTVGALTLAAATIALIVVGCLVAHLFL